MKKIFLIVVAALSAIIVEAQQLRDGHFFKTFSDDELTAKAAPEVFSQWFMLPQETEWREVSHQTDNIGMERIEYRQYVSGVEVEHSQVLLHVKDGRVQTANGTVMEQKRTPAKLQRHSVIHRGGTPTDLLGRKMLLIDTDGGYRYATMCISADGRYKVYHDVETGEELKRVPLMHNADVPEGTPATMTGKSIYSGDLTLDVTKGTDGMYYLYDQQRNIHTLVGAYLPSFDYLLKNGRAFDYFPRHDLTDEDIQNNDQEKITKWVLQIYADKAANNLPGFEKYITDNTSYMPNQGDTWTAYHLKSLALSNNTLDFGEEGYITVNFHYSKGTKESTSFGMLWSGATNKTDASIDFTEHDKIVIIPNEGATLVVTLIQNIKDEETQTMTLSQQVVEMIPLTFTPDGSAFNAQGQNMKIHLEYETNASTPLADIHWGMGRTVDFYKEKFNRDSYDDQHGPVYNLVYLDNVPYGPIYCSLDNAAAYASCKPYPMVYGMGGDLMNPVAELTVMGHEFTHIITDQNAKLEYKGESGALNESFSDIMGISVKKWDNPSYESWLIGDGLAPGYSNLRDMKNPRNSMDGKDESRRQPGYYQGYNWYDTNDTSPQNDSGGVHRNSGVQNRWYFLLCDGESADNGEFVEGGQPYSMTGIGMEKALQIAYRTLMQYATSQAQYADIRLCHLQSAKDLYGDNSPEVEAVAKAWDIVGVTDGNATGINSIGQKDSLTLDPSPKGEGSWYTLDGRLLEGKPTKKGMYIHNGKKIVVR